MHLQSHDMSHICMGKKNARNTIISLGLKADIKNKRPFFLGLYEFSALFHCSGALFANYEV